MSMKLIKKINNNYALALDSQGEQIIVYTIRKISQIQSK